MEKMRQRAEACRNDEQRFWEQAVEFWNPVEGEMSDARLSLKVIQFNALINLETVVREAPPCAITARSSHEERLVSYPSRLAQIVRKEKLVDHTKIANRDSAYLSKTQVSELFDAGSFLVQEYGLLLNTRIVIAHERLGMNKMTDGAELVSALVHELGMALKRSAPKTYPRFHWLYVHNRGTKSGFSTTVVAHIPEHLIDETEEWVFYRFLVNRFGSSAPKHAVQMRITRYQDDERKIRRHAQLMRFLCRSVHPEIKVRDHGERRALIDVISIPRHLREPFEVVDVRQRCRASKTIGEKAQRKAIDEGLGPLSAFGDNAWAFLFSGWERDEHKDRQREKEERLIQEAKINLDWPAGMGPRQNQVRAEFLDQLKRQAPRQRRRSWRPWWLRRERSLRRGTDRSRGPESMG